MFILLVYPNYPRSSMHAITLETEDIKPGTQYIDFEPSFILFSKSAQLFMH